MRRVLATALVVAVFAVTFALGFVFAPDSEAMTRCGTMHKYYSDATYTTQVGLQVWRPESCACFYHAWGTLTPFRIIEDATCFD